MALIVETGSGSSTAESYESVANTDTYLAKFGRELATWTAGSAAEKEEWLRSATQFIDTAFHRKWKGVSTSREQALSWPMWGVTDRSGFDVPGDEIPTKLKECCAELANIASGESLSPTKANPGSVKTKSVKVGPIAISTGYVTGKSDEKVFTIAARLLADYTRSGGRVVRA